MLQRYAATRSKADRKGGAPSSGASARSQTSSRRSRGSGTSGRAVAAALSGRRKGRLLTLVGDKLPHPKEKSSRSNPAPAPTEATVCGKKAGAKRLEEAALQAKPMPTTEEWHLISPGSKM